ncbi:MAG: hypothetical protein Kow0080_31550 [Candidatus Promineifilaceae bacterium]
MKVNFFATLRPIVGQKTVEFDLSPEMTVRDFVEMIVTKYPPLRHELLDDEGDLHRHVHVFVNGRDAPFLPEGMDTKLKPTDTLNVFPAVGGGSGDTYQESRQIRGIPLWLLREYLEELGGTAVSDTCVQGDGWQITLAKMEPFAIGSLRVGQVMMEITGETAAIEKLMPDLEKKTMRAGA